MRPGGVLNSVEIRKMLSALSFMESSHKVKQGYKSNQVKIKENLFDSAMERNYQYGSPYS